MITKPFLETTASPDRQTQNATQIATGNEAKSTQIHNAFLIFHSIKAILIDLQHLYYTIN